jgi:alpha-L-rhamnosidase
MKTLVCCLPLALSAGLLLVNQSAHAEVEAEALRCEYRVNPQGIDETQPRLSWQLDADDVRGVKQTAYQILVASSPALLKKSVGDLWDSGKVTSGASVQVSYAGKPLVSRQACYWKVRVYDQDGQASTWSEPATWTMGLLGPGDWQGRWIGKDEAETVVLLEGCSWIGYPEGLRGTDAPPGLRYYRRTFELPAGRTVRRAEMNLAGDNLFSCSINGEHALAGGSFSASTQLEATRFLRPGRNVIAVQVNNLGDSANPAGAVGKLTVEFESGEPLVIATDGQWKTHNQEVKQWHLPAFDDTSWKPAQVLGPVGMKPWGTVFGPENRRLAARMLRKEFTADKKVARAAVYFSGLGLSELYLNGKKVGDAVLSPGLTHYTKRAFYVTYDVTQQVRRGPNALGAWLGNGRFYAPRSASPAKTLSYGYPKLMLQLEIDYADGTRSTIVSDGTWRLCEDGPIQANNEYDGEEYDARREMPGWAKPGFDEKAWKPVRAVEAPGGTLSAQMAEPIRATGTLEPVALAEPKPGVYIFDMGQNLVGWCRLAVRGPAGASVKLRFAETVQTNGTLYLDNIRAAKVTDLYTLKGGGKEVYEPRFTYHGFRFVEVTGFPGKPTLASLAARVVNDDVPSAGGFFCSNPTINRIYQNTLWGVRGNYRSIPTDCPQRDERQGWLGDRSAECRGEAYLFDVETLYAKWVQDMSDSQKDSGSIPDVCPPYWPLYNDSVTWPSSAVIIPGTLYDQYADAPVLARQYPSMTKWIDYMSGFVTNGIIAKDSYGDWCVPPEDPKLIHSKDPARKTAPAIIATSYFYHCLTLMARYATVLEKPDDAKRFAALAGQLKTALNAKYFKPDVGYYDNGSQTACVLPLAFDMVPPPERGRVFDHLVKKITQETEGHVGTGLIGGQWLSRVLTDGGRCDLAYRLATNTTYPSWGYMIEQGATTIWELWNGNTADPAMNSGNHVMLVGDLVIWLYETLAGIKSDSEQPGFKHIIMRPQPVGDLTFVKASHHSPYGTITSEWTRKEGTFDWRITVPPNSTATVYVPAGSAEAVTESGKPISKAPCVKILSAQNGAVALEIGSGSYRFVARPR